MAFPPLPPLHRLGVVVLGLLLAATGTLAPASATPVEHGTFDGVDGTFSAFLTDSCGFPVTVTDHERDTFVDNRGLFVESIHITASVVGNGHAITLRTNSPLVVHGTTEQTVGLVVQVLDASGRRLTQISGQLRVTPGSDGVFHGHFLPFDLCDFLA